MLNVCSVFFLKVHFFKDLTQFNFIQLHKITTICISYKRDDKYFKLQYCLRASADLMTCYHLKQLRPTSRHQDDNQVCGGNTGEKKQSGPCTVERSETKLQWRWALAGTLTLHMVLSLNLYPGSSLFWAFYCS